MAKSGVRLFCSAECMEAAIEGWPRGAHAPQPVHAGDPPVMLPPLRKPRLSRAKLAAMFLGIASLSPCNHVGDLDLGSAAKKATVLPVRSAAAAPAAKPRLQGPVAPTEEELATEFMGEISGDVWIHPLAGPVRRMPIRTSRVFGAERNGDRPGECRNGHCGVDIGGEMWGEPIMAVHDGVIDRVKRDENGSGGMYVRIAHRDGKLFSQYFHLAAIPRELAAGDKVKAGQIIGLLGDTGVKESTAHLHFTISVKPTPTSREIYMDPEPLIALWPLKVPRERGGADASWDPGVPLGAAGRVRFGTDGEPLPRKADRKRSKKRETAAGESPTSEPAADSGDAEAAPEAPAAAEPSPPKPADAKPVRSPFATGKAAVDPTAAAAAPQ